MISTESNCAYYTSMRWLSGQSRADYCISSLFLLSVDSTECFRLPFPKLAVSRRLHSTPRTELEPFVLHPIDYSAANEYIAEHYKHVFEDGVYFENGLTSPFIEENHASHPKEPVYNARQGVIQHTAPGALELVPPTLDRDGFTLLNAPSQVSHWKDLPQIKSVYRLELQELIVRDLFPREEILHVVIWNPMFRGEQEIVSNAERDMSQPITPTSPTAGMVHIDQDVGAHGAEGILGLIRNNRLMEEDGDLFPEITELVKDWHRFAIVNFWRNAGVEPIRRQPLAVFSPQYKSKEGFYFPNDKPDPASSRWYTFPEMTPDELLVFKQYDRDGSYPSDIWHCALKSIADESAPPRESFDIRALVVFSSKVEPTKDRFDANRIRPVLNHEESGEFCDAQAAKRRG
jgi:hypothetical protein